MTRISFLNRFLYAGLLVFLLAACSSQPGNNPQPMPGAADSLSSRHNAPISVQYTGLKDPSIKDEESLNRGANLYTTNCASCHGVDGQGNGPAGAALDPAPPALTESITSVGDDYLFWRISEGGGPFNTSMPPWKSALDEQSRWDLIHYLRSLEK